MIRTIISALNPAVDTTEGDGKSDLVRTFILIMGLSLSPIIIIGGSLFASQSSSVQKAKSGVTQVILKTLPNVSTAPEGFDLHRSLSEDYGLEVRKEEDYCPSFMRGKAAGFFNPSLGTVCYSPAGGNNPQEVLRQEATHVVQTQEGLDEVARFIDENPLCEGNLSSSKEEKIEKWYDKESWLIEKQAWAIESEPECVRALVWTYK